MQQDNRVRQPAMSFIVRLWPEDIAGMQGEIENVRTGERRPFAGRHGLLTLLDQWRRDLDLVS